MVVCLTASTSNNPSPSDYTSGAEAMSTKTGAESSHGVTVEEFLKMHVQEARARFSPSELAEMCRRVDEWDGPLE